MSVIIELSQAQLDSIAQQQSGTVPPPYVPPPYVPPPTGTTPEGVQTFEHSQQMPVVSDVNGRIWVADLTFNGKRFATQGLPGQPWFYFTFKLPPDFNAIGWQGKVAQIQYSEYAEFGGKQYTKTCAFEKNGGAFAENIRYGSSGNYQMSFGFDYSNAIRVNPGELWYFEVKYAMQNGNPSASATDDGDMQVTPGAPGVV